MATHSSRISLLADEEDIENLGTAKVFGFIMRVRVAVLPRLLVAAGLLAAIDPRPMRATSIVTLTLSVVVWFLWEHRRSRRAPDRPVDIPVNILLVLAAQLVIVLTTGALSSPFLPAIALLSFVSSLVLGWNPFRWRLSAAVAVGLGIMAYAQTRGMVAPFSPAWLMPRETPGAGELRPWFVAGVIAVLSVALSWMGATLRGLFDAMLARATEARQEVLQSHFEQARDLTALSGEIAHELKNPLTSIKGLAGLLAMDVVEGKPAERLETLRREVDRMQGILEEFLNFSRPMVPLSQEAFNLGELCADVARLHEGMLRARGLRVAVHGSSRVYADPRKLRQVLINLVQNAAEVSPAGGAVVLRVEPEGGRVRVDVEDDGPGLPAGLGERIFEAGVTTREKGSGLGLTIARALARQHGGDLTLRDRAGGGCCASFWIPVGGSE